MELTKEEKELVERIRESDKKGCSRCLTDRFPIESDGWKVELNWHVLKVKRYDDKLELGITYCPYCGRYLKSEGE